MLQQNPKKMVNVYINIKKINEILTYNSILQINKYIF